MPRTTSIVQRMFFTLLCFSTLPIALLSLFKKVVRRFRVCPMSSNGGDPVLLVSSTEVMCAHLCFPCFPSAGVFILPTFVFSWPFHLPPYLPFFAGRMAVTFLLLPSLSTSTGGGHTNHEERTLAGLPVAEKVLTFLVDAPAELLQDPMVLQTIS